MGLDPPTLTTLSPILRELAYKSSPRLILSLRPQDPVPDWITHLFVLGENHTIALQGQTTDVLSKVGLWANGEDVPSDSGKAISATEMTARYGPALSEVGHVLQEKQIQPTDTTPSSHTEPPLPQETTNDLSTNPEPLIELQNVIVKYGPKVVLGAGSPNGLNLKICPGSRLLILGPNGSGKTTLLSLLTSDHPQSYSLPVFHFGRSRLPQIGRPGISIFDIQSRIGHSSPEIHAFFPRTMSIRGTLASAWAETFVTKPNLTPSASADIDAVLRWFEPELNPSHSPSSEGVSDLSWASNSAFHPFYTLSFQTQRLLLLLRALIKKPDIIILDEAFSGLSPYVREKAIAFLEDGFTTTVDPNRGKGKKSWSRVPTTSQTLSEMGESNFLASGITSHQALVVVSHVREEVPGVVDEWVRLPGEEELEASAAGGDAARIRVGREHGKEGVAGSDEGWRRIWGL